MVNKVYDDEFFNKDQKERYLEYLTEENTKKSYSRVLKRVSIMENKLNKDLYDFNLHEISQFLYLLKATKLSSLQHTGSIIRNYIGWAIEQDLRKDNINPLSVATTYDWYSQFLDSSETPVFNEEDIGNVVDSCINYQDKILLQAPFEGIMGRGSSELVNMKMKHISQTEDGGYTIKLFNESSSGKVETREIPISNDLYNMLRIANEEEEYIKNNGILKEAIKKRSNKLIENDYILRSAINVKIKQDISEPVPVQVVNRRIAKISVWNNLPMLKIINIRNSGMLKMAKDLFLKHKKLESDEYNIICERFNIKKDKNGLYHYGAMRSEFLNLATIKEVYELEG